MILLTHIHRPSLSSSLLSISLPPFICIYISSFFLSCPPLSPLILVYVCTYVEHFVYDMRTQI